MAEPATLPGLPFTPAKSLRAPDALGAAFGRLPRTTHDDHPNRQNGRTAAPVREPALDALNTARQNYRQILMLRHYSHRRHQRSVLSVTPDEMSLE